MGRKPCCDKVGLKQGPWTTEEDKKLINFIITNGQCCWRAVPKLAGLLRCGKSCRLRWTNYLRPDLKRGLLSEDEENVVIELHSQLGNRWSKIASHLPGRTDNEIKNHWNTHIKKKLKKMGIDPVTHKPVPPPTNQPQEQSQQQQVQPQEQSQQQQVQPQEPPISLSSGISETDQQNKEIDQFETSIDQSTITEAKEEEDKSMATLFDSMEVNNGFCTDEVPLIEPHEILVPCAPAPLSSSSSASASESSSSSSSSSSSCYTHGDSSTILENQWQFLPSFDWHCDFSTTMGFWDDEFFTSLDLFMSDDGDKNVTVEPDHNQYLRMVLDEESRKIEPV